jgi:fimbrial chaperone protein
MMMTTKKGKVVLRATFPFLLFFAMTVQSASLMVVPVRVDIEKGSRSATITLSNDGSAAASIQADISEWTQDESGKDIYSDTDDVIAVPGIFTIPPGGSQIVRIGLISDVAAPVERSYRVFLTELASLAEASEGVGLQIRLRLAVPIFVQATIDANPILTLVRSEHEDDELAVVLHNEGNKHVQVRRLDLKSSGFDRPSDTTTSISAYLLPGTARKFTLPVSPDTPPRALVVETDNVGTLEYEIPVFE